MNLKAIKTMFILYVFFLYFIVLLFLYIFLNDY